MLINNVPLKNIIVFLLLFTITLSISLFLNPEKYNHTQEERRIESDTIISTDAIFLQTPSIWHDSKNLKKEKSCDAEAQDKFPFRLFVTPEDQNIKALSAQVNSLEEAYQIAAQWIYVSEPILNETNDKWLTPQEFLEGTPEYPHNPVRGQPVSDCEEQANALVSILRALGIPPENVRVTVGEVLFYGIERGHVWVELFVNNRWLVLEPTCGPYWDDASDKLVQRKALPFNYYLNHRYPIVQVWVYFNDFYFL